MKTNMRLSVQFLSFCLVLLCPLLAQAQLGGGERIYLNNIDVNGKSVFGPGKVVRSFQNKVEVLLDDGSSYYIGSLDYLLPAVKTHNGLSVGSRVYINGLTVGREEVNRPAKVTEVFRGKVTVITESGDQTYYVGSFEKILKKVSSYHGFSVGDRVYLQTTQIGKEAHWGPAKVKEVYEGKVTIETDEGATFYVGSMDRLQKGTKSTNGISKGDTVFIDNVEVGGKIVSGPARVGETFNGRITVEMEASGRTYYMTDFSKILPQVKKKEQTRNVAVVRDPAPLPVVIPAPLPLPVPANASDCTDPTLVKEKGPSLSSWIKKLLKKEKKSQKLEVVKPSAPPFEPTAQEDSNCCKICMEADINAVVGPCGHMGTCKPCADNLKSKGGNCPFCRGKIETVLQVYKQ